MEPWNANSSLSGRGHEGQPDQGPGKSRGPPSPPGVRFLTTNLAYLGFTFCFRLFPRCLCLGFVQDPCWARGQEVTGCLATGSRGRISWGSGFPSPLHPPGQNCRTLDLQGAGSCARHLIGPRPGDRGGHLRGFCPGRHWYAVAPQVPLREPSWPPQVPRTLHFLE